MSSLTRRELDVLNLAKVGLSNAQIGEKLGLVEQTIKNHMRSIMRKLKASNRTEAVYLSEREEPSKMEPEQTLTTEYFYRGGFVALRVDTVEVPSGARTERVIVEHSPCTAIVAVIGKDVLLVRQFRKAVEKELLEIPAGKVDPGETTTFGAMRELEEETGYKATVWEKMGFLYTSPTVCSRRPAVCPWASGESLGTNKRSKWDPDFHRRNL